MVTVAEIVQDLEQACPRGLAASWDNVGLLLGDGTALVQRVMTCLTVTPESASEAVDAGVQLILSHHPVMFRPVQRLTTATPEGRTLLTLMRHGIAVASLHTAFDNCRDGINDILARRLELTEVAPLRPVGGPQQYKIVVFVPDSDLNRVADALFTAGAGHIGQYSECSFRLAGTGTFFGSDATNPTVGQKGRREEVAEWRLEAICPEASLEAAVAAMRRAHSYEEPAYDVYPLRAVDPRRGEGRVGRLPAAPRLDELALRLRQLLRADAVATVGDPGRRVERLALACGAGGAFLTDAQHAGADAFLTGELRFHDCLAAEAAGLALLLPGHYATERCGVEELAERLQRRWPDLEIWASRRERDPLRWQTA
ncbi:MAG: Nif3-like dinuclear metal center hexameric protein [Gemmataceae bacterium]|nr:Nif3-like dinuclear metal center hexameric protein [Gemmataceae bacterium]MDW8266266.1 Nif3-like dinuclear metal center hexameric protein [Gemmataceae bacterium]